MFSALLALESGIITKNNSQMTWDGTQYPYKEWNQDQDLFSAMSSSATWYFKTGPANWRGSFASLSQIYPLWK
ncbi:penicillin-binding transpeptidase domain-containing protein [Bacillus licheniformis]|nr:penicillin-binding transpeptidase domain-containing protein [Bacillus licheniformis]